MAEHTELVGRSLPPGPLQNQVLQTAQANNPLPIVQLEQLIKSGQVQSLMSPMMLEHEIKEAKRGEQRIRQLLRQ